MKKFLFLIGLMLVLTTSLFAQKAAVMEFKYEHSSLKKDADTISRVFKQYFRPAGYTMVEKAEIDRVIAEKGFQKNSLTQDQIIKIGQVLNLSMIVIGDITTLEGPHSVGVKVIDVKSGAIRITDGETFRYLSEIFRYHDLDNPVKKLAKRLAAQVAIRPPESKHEVNKLKWSEKTVNKMKWEDAVNYCKNLDKSGKSSWRLPNIDELRTLIKNCPSTQTGGICSVKTSCVEDKCWKADTCGGCYESYLGNCSVFGDEDELWSSTPNTEGSSWFVDFSDGGLSVRFNSDYVFVRCVR